jgi:hypothetical protein
MPHVVVQGARPLPDLVAAFEPIRASLPEGIVKVEQAFVERTGQHALFPALTIAGDHRQAFLVHAAAREGKLTVRLDPVTDPEKTPAVQAAIVLVAAWACRASPGATFGPTNLAPLLQRVAGA